MNRRIEKRLVLKPKIKRFVKKLMLTTIVILIGLILTKNNPKLKEVLKENILEKSINFNFNKKIYTKYLGKFLNQNNEKVKPVFSEKITYQKQEQYLDGVELTVENNYQVPSLESGVIIYLGDKENYGKTIIVEQVDGIETSYTNVDIKNYKLYDYIEKGDILGTTINDKLIVSFQKEGKYLDYQKYI